MSDEGAFPGFPAVGKATAVPHAFFSRVLPEMRTPAEAFAFLWAARVLQERRGDERFVSAAELWALPAAARSFDRLAGGRRNMELGLDACVVGGALLALDLEGEGGAERVYFLNEPGSRRLVARARAGAIELRPGARALPAVPAVERPGIFDLYEQNIGTITPLVGERLIWAAETFSPDWILDAFREAAELNRRNWRYIERILTNWAEEGRGHETAGRDPGEAQRERYLGGAMGRVVRTR